MVGQVLAFEEFHGDIGQIVLFTRIENGHDILVLQAPGCFRFAEKALTRVDQFVASKLLAQGHGLDGHNTTNLGVLAQIDHAHGALAQFLFDLVAAQHGFFYRAAFQQHGATGMATTAAQHHGF